ncbi:MAG: HigA family addiction module antitoxin, partial [Desulfobacterales bacterium]
MVTNKDIYSDLAIPPGEYLEEVLYELGMTKDELARRMGRPATKLSPIFKGEKAITPETALQLEQVVGVPAHIWLGLETEYRLTLARQESGCSEEELAAEGELVKEFQYSALVKAGMVEKFTKKLDKIQALRRFFGVMSLLSVTDSPRYQAAFRYGKSVAGERTPEAVAAWLRMGELRAQGVICKPFDADKLKGALKDLRAMTLEKPEEFQERLHELLADCGVALVICPHFPKTKAHGATFWIGRNKAVLMLTIRFK